MLKDSKQSNSATTAVTFITIGSLMAVWSAVYYYLVLRNQESNSNHAYFWDVGFFLSGIVLIVIGIALGKIGRAVREAEVTGGAVPMPPPSATPAAPPAPAAPANGVPPAAVPTARHG